MCEYFANCAQLMADGCNGWMDCWFVEWTIKRMPGAEHKNWLHNSTQQTSRFWQTYHVIFQNWFKGQLKVKTQVNLRCQEEEKSPKQPGIPEKGRHWGIFLS